MPLWNIKTYSYTAGFPIARQEICWALFQISFKK